MGTASREKSGKGREDVLVMGHHAALPRPLAVRGADIPRPPRSFHLGDRWMPSSVSAPRPLLAGLEGGLGDAFDLGVLSAGCIDVLVPDEGLEEVEPRVTSGFEDDAFVCWRIIIASAAATKKDLFTDTLTGEECAAVISGL
jgi:hypothetical protein